MLRTFGFVPVLAVIAVTLILAAGPTASAGINPAAIASEHPVPDPWQLPSDPEADEAWDGEYADPEAPDLPSAAALVREVLADEAVKEAFQRYSVYLKGAYEKGFEIVPPASPGQAQTHHSNLKFCLRSIHGLVTWEQIEYFWLAEGISARAAACFAEAEFQAQMRLQVLVKDVPREPAEALVEQTRDRLLLEVWRTFLDIAAGLKAQIAPEATSLVGIVVPELASPGNATLPFAVPLAQQALDATEVKAAFRAHAQAVKQARLADVHPAMPDSWLMTALELRHLRATVEILSLGDRHAPAYHKAWHCHKVAEKTLECFKAAFAALASPLGKMGGGDKEQAQLLERQARWQTHRLTVWSLAEHHEEDAASEGKSSN